MKNNANKLEHEFFTHIEGEQLEDRGEGGNYPPPSLEELIRKCKIDLAEELAPPPIAMEINSENKLIPLFTKGNFSIIAGPPKSRKTFLISMLIAAAIKGFFQGLFFCTSKGTNLVFDTEQSRYKSQQIAKRICGLAGTTDPEYLQFYSLRTLDPLQRIELIGEVLKTTPNVNFVVIDGIIDLDLDPIMVAEQAQAIISKLMVWSEIYNIHIACVLHYNKEKGNGFQTLLGHLGSVAHRKADAVIEVKKSKDDSDVSEVRCVDSREMDFEPFAFTVDGLRMPCILPDYSFEKTKKEKKTPPEPKPKFSPNYFSPDQHEEILELVFRSKKEHTYSELWRSIKISVDATTERPIGDNMAKEFATHYQNENLIVKIEIGKVAVYTLAGQAGLTL